MTAKLPNFSVDLAARESLTGQVASGFRKLIAAGYYRVGDRLPSRRPLASHLGVSEFVVRAAFAELAADSPVRNVSSAWDVSFAYHPGITAAPPRPVRMEQLRDFTSYGSADEADGASIRYFSGTATYRTTVDLTPDEAKRVRTLEVGEPRTGIAHVVVNGADCGIAWCAPWRVCVSGKCKAGLNEIEIRYTNNWYNRLVGDCRLPAADRVTRSTLHYWTTSRTGDPVDFWTQRPTVYSGPSAFDALQPSGFVGPVRLLGENR